VLARLPASGDVRDEVRRVLSSQLTVGEVRIDTVAHRLATTPRTLQRRLSRAGTSFGALCDEARKQAAESYLAETSMTIAEVTYLLGYAEPTAFHRAFRRWHSISPMAFRARMTSASRRSE
jgi:AraC-like DNA-binding protein